jgi:hypothetical protein
MSRLAALQAHFQDFLLRGDGAIETQVEGSARVPVAARLGIYAHAYRSRLIAALGTNFPALEKLLDEEFGELAGAYVDAHDSHSTSIRWYGAELPQFLATHAHYGAAPVLAELARWEWAMSGVFDAADAVPVTHGAFAGLSPERWGELRFSWHPSLTRLQLHWNVPQTWKALNADEARPELEYSARGSQWLLWRQDLTSWFRSLSDTEAGVLDAARQGESFAQLCARLSAELGEAAAPAEAATLLRGWVAGGLITAIG